MPDLPGLPDLPDLPDFFGDDPQEDEPQLVDQMEDGAGPPPPPGAAVGDGGAPPAPGAGGGDLGAAPPVPPGVPAGEGGDVGNPEPPVAPQPVEQPVDQAVQPVDQPVEQPPVVQLPVDPEPEPEPVTPEPVTPEPVTPEPVAEPAGGPSVDPGPVTLEVADAPDVPAVPGPVADAVSGGAPFDATVAALGDVLGTPGTPAPEFSLSAPPAAGEATLLLPDSPELPAMQVTGVADDVLSAAPLDGGPPMSFPLGDVSAAVGETGQEPVSFAAPVGGFALGAAAGALTGLTAVAVRARRLRQG